MAIQRILGQLERRSISLAMATISVVQEEQALVAWQLKSALPPLGVVGGAGIIGATPASSSTASVGMRPPLPQQPALDRTHRASQVMNNQPHSRGSVLEISNGEGDHSEAHRTWVPKMDSPHFDGSDPRIWIDKCSAYFTLYQIPPTFRVSTASIHMLGVAAHWFQTYKQTPGFQQWEQFLAALVTEFETDTLRAKTIELLSLRQSGNVEEYRRAFDQLVYHITLYDSKKSSGQSIGLILMSH
jgi:hypothetical protein